MLRQILAGCGLFLGLWALGALLWSRLLLPPEEDLILLLRARGDGAGLEQSLRACLLLRRRGLLRPRIILWDQGLDPEGRRLAERLAERWSCELVRSPAALRREDGSSPADIYNKQRNELHGTRTGAD